MSKNKSKLFSLILLLTMIALTTLQSCEKDKVVTTGTLRITYAKHNENLMQSIYSIENPDISINTKFEVDSKGTWITKLNMGNYILKISNSNYFSRTVGFQIKADETTTIQFDAQNNPTVK